MGENHRIDDGASETADGKPIEQVSHKLPEVSPHEIDGLCSRCGAAWPCLRCLTTTPPYVHVWNNL